MSCCCVMCVVVKVVIVDWLIDTRVFCLVVRCVVLLYTWLYVVLLVGCLLWGLLIVNSGYKVLLIQHVYLCYLCITLHFYIIVLDVFWLLIYISTNNIIVRVIPHNPTPDYVINFSFVRFVGCFRCLSVYFVCLDAFGALLFCVVYGFCYDVPETLIWLDGLDCVHILRGLGSDC